MLKQLQIKNFKGWRDTGSIRMAPITLFFGTNSSGKSSIGQFLMMLKQTVESPDRRAVFYPGGKNSVVQLGSYQEMVYNREPRNEIAFSYRWSLSENLEVKNVLSPNQVFSGDQLQFCAKVGLAQSDRQQLLLNELHYDLIAGDSPVLSIGMQRKSGDKAGYEVSSPNYSLTRTRGRAWDPTSPVRFYGFPDEVVAYYQNADFVQDINLHHEKFYRTIHYLGPLRTKAERLYSWSGNEPESVGYTGDNTIAALLAAQKSRKISMGVRKKARPFEEVIAAKLKEMGLIESFRVRLLSESRQEYEVNVKTKGSKDWVDLPDVGFGISQVLPVLVQCFYAPSGSIIIMEQPEIHLHPMAQSVLADVMIDVINSRENSTDRNIQLIIETHSEHFLRRLQRRIAEDMIEPEKVAAYFANVSQTPATLDPLEIDILGNIRNWPKDFFGDEMSDIIEHSRAALKKRMRKDS